MAEPFTIAGTDVAPGETVRLELPVARLPTHTMLHLPVTVARGRRDGPRLWLSAALHGDELNGMEIIRRVLDRLTRTRLRGTVIAVPIVNVFGFINQSRYLPDRRDLNRSFPGSARGSLASRLAHLFMREIVAHATHGIDLHTAAPPRVNLPQIRCDLDDPVTRGCAKAFAAPVMLGGSAPRGALRAAAARRGVPVLLYEGGEPLRFNPDAIRVGVNGVLRVMAHLKMIDRAPSARPGRSMEAESSVWVRAAQSGVLYPKVELGEQVVHGDTLATISDPFGDASLKIRAPSDGTVIGLTNNPLVHRGDGLIHLATNGSS